MTNVYLMRDGYSKFYKIGISIDPKFREKTLLSQAPLIELHTYWKDLNPIVEKNLHARFDDKRKRGEWFDLTDNDVDQIYYDFWDAERVDVVPPPERLERWCQLQTAYTDLLKRPIEPTIEKVIEIQYVQQVEPVSGLGRIYSERTLRDMRFKIARIREEAARTSCPNPDLYEGYAMGVVWASGVD